MKQELFNFLNSDLQFIKGVGPVLAARFNDLLGSRRVVDFLLHIPRAVKSRPPIESVIDGTVGEIITIPLEIRSVKKSSVSKYNRRPIPTQVIGFDKLGGQIVLQFFGSSFLDYWLLKLPIGSTRMISGKLESVNGKFVINHPDFIEPMENASKIPEFQAIYPLSNGLTGRIMAHVRDGIFNHEEILNSTEEIITLFKKVHYPSSNDELLPINETIKKLAYFELLAAQIAIAMSRDNRAKKLRKKREKKYDYYEKLKSLIPYDLTDAQKRTLDEITKDMQKPETMMRLIQGDVGSGKTIVALFAMVQSLDFGAQSVFLAPTDALAMQHFKNTLPFCEKLGIVCDLLTGRDKGKTRHEKLISIKSGRTKITVGTHALFSEDVEYKDLGLAVIDEQHRFAVLQRNAMTQKGESVDILALSATPIPRTLSMTIYGDMDISIINEKPKGRLPIITTKLEINQISRLIERMKKQLTNGRKAFWVCPLVEESEVTDMMNVQTRFDNLKKHFKVGLIHGQMDKKDRDKIMSDFANGELQVLVATSVIEVGIDVPNAVIMVIENAERFGLSALHQIRGRVGRSDTQSYCILLHGHGISENGLKRLQILCDTNDGFVIAEQDLMMRGVGEILALQ